MELSDEALEHTEDALMDLLHEQAWYLPRDGAILRRWETEPADLCDELATWSVSAFFDEPRLGLGTVELSPNDVECLRFAAWLYSVSNEVEDRWLSVAAHMVRFWFKPKSRSLAAGG